MLEEASNFLLLLQYCNLCYIILPQQQNKKRTRRIQKITFSFHILLLFVLVVYIYQNFNEVLFTTDIIGKLNNYIKFVSFSVTYLVILLESHANRENCNKIWSLLEELDAILKDFHEIDMKSERQKFIKKFIRTFIVFWTIILCVIQLNWMWLNWRDHKARHFSLIFTLPGLITKLRQWQFIFYAEIINFYLKKLNEVLKIVSTLINLQSKMSRQHRNERYYYQKLNVLKSYYDRLYDISNVVAACFCWTFLFHICKDQVQIFGDVYWIIFRISNNVVDDVFGKDYNSDAGCPNSNHLGKFWLFQGFVLSVVPKIYFLIMLCNSFNKILVNVRYTPYHLHQIELQAEADAEESEYDIDCLVENFSLQILHQPIQFTAMGFFSINFQQLREVRTYTTGMPLYPCVWIIK